MTAQEILNDIYKDYSEYLEMMNIEEKFIIITSALANKLAMEIALKDHYKTCWNDAMKPSIYKGINS